MKKKGGKRNRQTDTQRHTLTVTGRRTRAMLLSIITM